MAVLRDAHNASRFGLGLLVLEGCGPLFLGCLAASAPMLPSHVRLTVVGLLHCFVVVRTGLLVPPLRPIPAPAGLLACRSTGPTLQFLYSRTGSIRKI